MTADSPIPCVANAELVKQIHVFAEVLKTQAHLLGEHGLDEKDFYNSGLFRGAIERIRGQFSATMAPKREFVRHILNYMQDRGAIKNWSSAGEANRHDYVVELLDGKLSAIELKGAMDGNNTNIFERPPHVNEFIMWSISTNLGGSPPHNAWSGIHTRLSADIISRAQQVDGLIIWDWVCGTAGRPCPKVTAGGAPTTVVGPYELPPPCIYLFPATIPAPRNNPHPVPQTIDQVGILKAFHECFGGSDHHLHAVDFSVEYKGVETLRTTTIRRDGNIVKQSSPTPIQRT